MQLIRDGLGSIPAAIYAPHFHFPILPVFSQNAPVPAAPFHSLLPNPSLSSALISPIYPGILNLLTAFQSAAAIATTVSSPRPPLPLNPIRPNTINYPASHKDLRALKG